MGKKKGRDRSSKEENIIDLTGPSCSHIRKGIDHILFKKTSPEVDWSSCQDCQEAPSTNSEDGMSTEPQVIWMCLKCGHRGCGRYSEDQHAVKHYEKPRSDPHCLVLNLDNWSVWCYICDDSVQFSSTGQLAQLVTNLKKQAGAVDGRKVSKTRAPAEERSPSCNGPKVEKEASNVVDEEEEDKENKGSGKKRNAKKDASPVGKKTETVDNTGAVTVRGLSNLGNTCFFNAVVQNLSQTQLLRQILCSVTKEKRTATLTPNISSGLEPMEVHLAQPGSLTLSMWQLLNEIQETKKGVVTPRELFTQVCKKAARFKGFQQQDSQELLRYLLDGMRAEEMTRFKCGITEAWKSSGKNAESEESKTLMRNYERNGALRNFVDHVFGGEMTSTVMCKECKTVSVVTEMFLDLSLPVSDEAFRKKNQKKGAGAQRSSISDDARDSSPPPLLTNGKEDMPTGAGSKYQQKKAKKQAKKQGKNQRRSQKQDGKGTLDDMRSQEEDDEEESGGGGGGGDAPEDSPPQPQGLTGAKEEERAKEEEESPMDTDQPSAIDHSEQGQEKRGHQSSKGVEEGQQQECEDGEQEGEKKQQEEKEEEEEGEEEEDSSADVSAVSNRFTALADDQSSETEKNNDDDDDAGGSKERHEKADEDMEEKEEEEEEKLTEKMNHLTLNGTTESGETDAAGAENTNGDARSSEPDGAGNETQNGDRGDGTETQDGEEEEEEEESPEYTVVHQDPETAFHTLAPRTAPDKQECSVQSCLFQFTEVEQLTQSNSLLCVTCTKRQRAPKDSQGAKKNVYRDALKQMLISAPPPVLTLHLKRFQQVAYSVCKVNRHVQFPQLLDLAPYCSVSCKNVSEGMTQVLYGLYGIVEHSGTMRSGHYTAYVKARPSCQSMTPNGVAATTAGHGEPPKGSWFYISDSSVQPVSEAKVQSSQAYLLFYERIS